MGWMGWPRTFPRSERGPDITVSAGVAAARGADVDYDDLFGAADAALYRAKGAGRNRVMTANALETIPAPAPADGQPESVAV
jgi:PleD family two-component response regulator